MPQHCTHRTFEARQHVGLCMPKVAANVALLPGSAFSHIESASLLRYKYTYTNRRTKGEESKREGPSHKRRNCVLNQQGAVCQAVIS